MSSVELSSCCSCYVFSQWFAYFFLIKLACVASVSTQLHQESWDKSKKKKELQGRVRTRGKKDPLLPFPSPFHLFFGSYSNFRAITRLETIATRAIIKRVKCSTILYSLPKQLNLRSSQVFLVNCSVFWELSCLTDIIFHLSQNSSKFG